MALALRRPRHRPAAARPAATTRATGAAAGAAGSGLLLVARLVRLVTLGVAAIIVAAILFTVFEANASNGVVSTITDWARFLVGPFKDLFSIENAKWETAVNWGLAALLYVLVGGLIARMLARGGMAGRRARSRRVA